MFPYPYAVNTDRNINPIYFYPNYHAKGHSSELFWFSLFVVCFKVRFPSNSCFILPFLYRKWSDYFPCVGEWSEWNCGYQWSWRCICWRYFLLLSVVCRLSHYSLSIRSIAFHSTVLQNELHSFTAFLCILKLYDLIKFRFLKGKCVPLLQK